MYRILTDKDIYKQDEQELELRDLIVNQKVKKMSIGLFLDVDDVLTQEPINMQLARLMGVQKGLLDAEHNFHINSVNNNEFNKVLIPLFKSKRFTKNYVHDNYNNFSMRINYEDILKSCEHVFLLSSGPSYFVDILAQKMSIPENRVLCSRYVFDNTGIISGCSKAVDQFVKADFVRKFTNKFDLTIGIGNNPEQDSAFLAHCDVKILMDEFRDGYICVRDFKTIVEMISAFKGEHRKSIQEVPKPIQEIPNKKGGYLDPNSTK